VGAFPPAEQFKALHMLRLLAPEVRQERSRLWAEIKL